MDRLDARGTRAMKAVGGGTVGVRVASGAEVTPAARPPAAIDIALLAIHHSVSAGSDGGGGRGGGGGRARRRGAVDALDSRSGVDKEKGAVGGRTAEGRLRG